MLMLRAPGCRLDSMLSVISPRQLEDIAVEVAKYTAKLARYTSGKLETVNGAGCTSQWLLGEPISMLLCHPEPTLNVYSRCLSSS